jgi:hypothetical protein
MSAITEAFTGYLSETLSKDFDVRPVEGSSLDVVLESEDVDGRSLAFTQDDVTVRVTVEEVYDER